MSVSKEGAIGVFDSGIGGLTVAKAIVDLLPSEQLFYFGDTAHLPYGDKSTSAIQAYSIKICNVLLEQGCKVIVIACNSASAAAYELVKEYVGSRAIVINVIDPVVGVVAKKYSDKKVGLIGTKQTVSSGAYDSKLAKANPTIELSSLATPLLVPMIEEGFVNNNISHNIIDQYMKEPMLKKIKALILGCTHYPLIKSEIKNYFSSEIDVIDAPETVSLLLKEVLEEKGLLSDELKHKHTFFVSDLTDSFKASTEVFFGEEVNLKHYPLWD